MAKMIKGLLLSKDSELAENLSFKLRNTIEFLVRELNDYISCHEIIKENNLEAVFIDLQSKSDHKKALRLARQLRNKLPNIKMFFLGKEKDPDLILEGLRIGISDYLVPQDHETDILDLVMQSLMRGKEQPCMGKIYSLFSLKGGLGVTTLAVNLADHINKLSESKVILVDLNLYMGNVSNYLDFSIKYTPFNLLKDIERIDDNLLFSSLNRHECGFYLLGVSGEISDADQTQGGDITRMLEVLKAHADYIILDIPHDFSERSLAALEISNKIMVVVQQDIVSIKSAQRALEIFNNLNYSNEKVVALLNRFQKRNDITPKDVAGVLQHPVHSIIRNDFRVLLNTSNLGKTVDTMEPESNLNKDFSLLASRISGVRSQSVKRRSLKSFLFRLWRLKEGHK